MRTAAGQERGVGRWAVHTGAWILAGVLIVSIALIFTAREDRLGFPSVTNTRASGYAAMAELLRRDGYQVRLERTVRPEFGKGETVLALTRGGQVVQEEDFDVSALEEPAPVDLHTEQIKDHLRSGGSVIEIVNSEDFEIGSAQAAPKPIQSAFSPDVKYSVTLPAAYLAQSGIAEDQTAVGSWIVEQYQYVTHTRFDKGTLVTVGEGLPFTNRFLDHDQNAAYLLRLVHSVAAPGSGIVIDEAGIGNAESPTVTNTLGHWAVAARWQVGILFVVLIYTLSRRFGLPETERRSVRSSRELFDAVSDVLRRTSNTGLALDNLLVECDQRIRRVLNAPTSAKRSDILQSVPAALRDQYLHVSEHANANSSPRQATAAAAKLLRLMQEFESDSRAVRGLKR